MENLNDLLGIGDLTDVAADAAARGNAINDAIHASIQARTGMSADEAMTSDPTTRYNTLYLAVRGVLAMAPSLDPDIVVEALHTAGGMWQTARPLPSLEARA